MCQLAPQVEKCNITVCNLMILIKKTGYVTYSLPYPILLNVCSLHVLIKTSIGFFLYLDLIVSFYIFSNSAIGVRAMEIRFLSSIRRHIRDESGVKLFSFPTPRPFYK